MSPSESCGEGSTNRLNVSVEREITVRRHNWIRLNPLRIEFLTKSATTVIDQPLLTMSTSGATREATR